MERWGFEINAKKKNHQTYFIKGKRDCTEWENIIMRERIKYNNTVQFLEMKLQQQLNWRKHNRNG